MCVCVCVCVYVYGCVCVLHLEVVKSLSEKTMAQSDPSQGALMIGGALFVKILILK